MRDKIKKKSNIIHSLKVLNSLASLLGVAGKAIDTTEEGNKKINKTKECDTK